MSAVCYLSNIHYSQAGRPFADHRTGEPGERDRVEVRINIRAATFWKVKCGEDIDRAAVPRRFYKYMGEDEYAGMPEFHSLPPVFVNDWLLVMSHVRQVFLAQGVADDRFVPVELFQKDGESLIDGSYFVVIPGLQAPTIDIARSTRIRQPQSHLQEYFLEPWSLPPSAKNKTQIVARPDFAAPGPLWVDPLFPGLLLVSLPLADALRSAGLEEAFGLYPVMGA